MKASVWVVVLMFVVLVAITAAEAQTPELAGPVQAVPTGPDFEISDTDKVLGIVAQAVGYTGPLRTSGYFQTAVTGASATVILAFIKAGQIVCPVTFNVIVGGNPAEIQTPLGVFISKRQDLTYENGRKVTVFTSGQKLVVFFDGRCVLGNPDPNDPTHQIIVPSDGRAFWGVIDLDLQTSFTPPPVAPVIGQAALARIAWYRQAAAEKGIKAALVVVLDANGELMYGAKASVLVTKPNGGSYLPVSGMGDGIVAFYDFAGGETVHVYIDGREVLADIYGKPLPAMTVAGQETVIFVQGKIGTSSPVSQTTLNRLAAYGLVPDRLSESHEFQSTGARGFRIPFLAVLVDGNGNLDPNTPFHLEIVDQAGNRFRNLSATNDGIICLADVVVGQRISVFVNNVEVVKTLDSKMNLPIITREGIGNLILVSQGGR